MKNYLINILIWVISISLTACTGHVPASFGVNTITANDSSEINNPELTKIYSQAIADYIKAVYKKDKTVFDTLFFGKRNFGQPDDFPNLILPETIENTKIRLVDPEVGKKLQKERKSRVYVNMVGWVEKKKAEFIFVTFSNGFEHKFDFYSNYLLDDAQNEFILEKSRIEVLILNEKDKADHFAVYEDCKYVCNKPIH